MSCGSLEPPPVKMLALGFGSATQSTAVAPPKAVVLFVVEQSPLTSWGQTLAQSSPGAGPLTALPSSSNAPVSWTASAGATPSAMTAARELATASPRVSHRRPLRLPVPCVSDTLIFPLLGRVLMLGDPWAAEVQGAGVVGSPPDAGPAGTAA